MKKILFTFSFIFLTFNLFGQSPENLTVQNSAGVVQDIYLAKDDGKGKAGEPTENFATTDVPIHCVVMLDSETAAVVKMVFVAVSVKNVKPESKVVTVSYKTDGKQNQVNFTGKPDGAWTAGNYRVDIFLNDKPVGNRTFSIEKSAGEPEKINSPVIKKFVSPKSAPKPKLAGRIVKN